MAGLVLRVGGVTVCGIDFSSKAVDVVLLEEDSDAAVWHRFELSGQDAFDRARDVWTQLPGQFNSDWEGWGVVAVGIEEPRGFGAGSLYRIQGAILACIPRELLVQPLIPSQWRKTVGLPGNASKLDVAVKTTVLRTAARTLDAADDPWPQDACDAYCIALATRMMLHATEQAA